MLDSYKAENILFLDIETVPAFPSFEQMPENWKNLWEKKSQYFRKSEESASDVFQRAGIYSEFGKIICISVGYIQKSDGIKYFNVKSFYGADEKDLLIEFSNLLGFYKNKEEHYLCAHNGKEFDFPYIARRCLVNGLPIPAVLDLSGKKPWEVKHLDTMELWKFGDYKNYTSLELLALLFNIPTPKDDIDGSMVADVFYKQNDLERIVKYCEKDVLTIAQLFLKFKGETLILSEHIRNKI